MPFRPNVFCFFLLSIAIASCGSDSGSAPPDGASQPTSVVRNSVLNVPPCDAPCWQGIKIGDVTSVEDVTKVINALPNVDTPWQPILGTVSWHWKWAKHSGPNSIYLYIGTVESISLYFDSDVSVAEIVEKYGKPVAIRLSEAALPEESHALLLMYYPTRGITFVAYVTPRTAPELTPTTNVVEVRYSMPQSIEAWKTSEYQKDLQPWPEYGKLTFPSR